MSTYRRPDLLTYENDQLVYKLYGLTPEKLK